MKIVVLGDNHLGHPVNKTTDKLLGLSSLLTDELLSTIDLLIFEGDFFDRQIDVGSSDLYHISIWINGLILKCYEYGVIVRILEGTPSHDNRQSIIFKILAEASGLDIDLKYVEELSIEHISKFNINVLYVPDRITHSTKLTYEKVLTLLENNSLDRVDFAVMHGAFDYQMPYIVNSEEKHDSKDYLKIVKYLIFIGHVHQMSNYDRIFAAGSSDRDCHGDESPKGMLSVNIDLNTSMYEVDFIENKLAKKFITVKLLNYDLDSIISKLNAVIMELPTGSHIRVIVDEDSILLKNNDLVKQINQFMIWKIESARKKEIIIDNKEITDCNYKPLILSKDTIKHCILDFSSGLNLDSNDITSLKKCLDEMVEAVKC